ncbi:lysophospholipase [Mycena alexandri]|uniref:Lysophospholipase n=1 Tax=Mycena alexandri TaxID=1745969 RepID=A0AAD6WW75_9AGAR|nr:lysophospholipase [Mycena alexandri]
MFSVSTISLLLVLSGAANAAALGPTLQRCPADFELVRRGQTISGPESQYIKERREKVLPGAFKTYLQNVQRTGVQLPKYVEEILESRTQLPTVGITVSGGGARAAIFGAGVLNALDERNSSSAKKGTGGLLQSATHLAGLSGGSWLVTSLAQANFPTMQHLVFGDGHEFGGWLPEFNLWAPSTDPAEQAIFAHEILQELAVKAKHFPVSVGDAWGRALARHFTNGTTNATFFANTSHGSGILFSDLINLPTLASHQQPFPVIVMDIISKHINGTVFPGGNVLPLNSPMFEINLFEMGCYDDVLAAHTPTKHLGTTNKSLCVTGFDEAMFLSGTSSNLWNELNITAEILAENTANFSVLVNETYPQSPALRLDTSNYPNPFHGVAPDTFSDSHETILSLCDGGEDGQVSPLQPMLVPDRKIDVIVAIDATNDANGFAAGASLIATQQRMQIFARGLAAFPAVPTTLVGFANLTAQPTFFGCTPSSSSSSHNYDLEHAHPAAGPMMHVPVDVHGGGDAGDAGANVTIATQGAEVHGALEDPEWPACLACAVVDRARGRQRVARTGVCETCFARYCWEA